MREKIINILNEVYQELLIESEKLTKPNLKTVNISKIKPYELQQFMIDNNIPDDACFKSTKHKISLSWFDGDRSYTNEEKADFIISLFEYRSEDRIIELLESNDYKYRTCSELSHKSLQLIDSSNFYRAYIDGNLNMIIDYFFERFEKNYKDKDKLPDNAEYLIRKDFERVMDELYRHDPNSPFGECVKQRFNNSLEIENIVADKLRYLKYYVELTNDKYIIVSWNYKRGTEVNVITEKWYNSHRDCLGYVDPNHYSNHYSNIFFTPNMAKYLNKKAIITDICDGYYKIDIDGGENKWKSWMFNN